MNSALGVVVVLLLIATNAFFVAVEFALVAVDRSRIAQRASEGSRRARVALRVLGRLSFHLSGAQLGITLGSILLGVVAEDAMAGVLDPIIGSLADWARVLIVLFVATILQLLVGELIPKNVALARTEPVTLALAGPLRIIDTILKPVIWVTNESANAIIRKFGVEPTEELTSVRSIDEIAYVIRSSGEEGTIEPDAVDLLNRTIRFSAKTADDALVPRVEVVGIARDGTVADLVDVSARSGHSRFVIYGGDLDDIVGQVHVKDALGVDHAARPVTPVTALMRDVFVVPETRPLETLLPEMKASGNQLAVVVDEYGGTAGIVTLEDLLEELVGEIDDEYDEAAEDLTAGDIDGNWHLPGSLHPDEVADVCGFRMPEGDYETLAGFVLDRLARIPEPGDGFTYEGWSVEVTEMDRLRVARVEMVSPLMASTDPEPGIGEET
ncbi:MAG: HlyC/CorC family transporter [Actinomycetia bacterium]|nr:HlyC/CorC family transporter [Actinomycetes bacterium]